MTKKINPLVIISGVVVGLAALTLTALGNPANMGFCIACFLRDIAGATKLHTAAVVQYVRPEIIGIVLGSTVMSLASHEFRARAGSSPATRFILGAFVMIGALVFLGCPLRMVIRMGGGDLNAFVGLAGFFIGILIGIFFLKRGFSLKRSYEVAKSEGFAMPGVMLALLVLFLAVPTLFAFSEEGPGSKHAPALVA
ncbi:MAG: YedE-related selenium metabolism membrane protein, partial [Oscillospiraceae bacterium]|nr:YedE-related selenium metabolism membrane protein [Oscillospiraceae bacterium]